MAAVAQGLDPLLDTTPENGGLPGAGTGETAPSPAPIAPTWGGGDPLVLGLRGNNSLDDIRNGSSVMSISNWTNFSVNAVEDLQRLLGFTGRDIDGSFGLKTKSAVEEFQSSKGLKVDGIVGVSTLKALDDAQN